METKPDQTKFPRITLRCRCNNEFNVNVMRFRDKEPVMCQVCGEIFPQETGANFTKALEDLYLIKYNLEKNDYPFHFSFIYKSSFKQPPAPYPFEEKEDKTEQDKTDSK